ncbi:MAG: hypothetical protein GX552_07090 [Chloroflexi bacterium]|nr:hypothetical protein [Chloroflexota bacterium]
MTNSNKLQSVSLILAVVGGLLILLGAIVVGLWMTQEQASGSLVSGQSADSIQPWRLKENQQMQFILLLAQDYALDKDVHRAREAVAGWDLEDLGELFGTIEFQTTDTETLKQIIGLRKALGLPASTFATPSLLKQDSVLWSAGLALLFLVGAGAVAFWPSKKAEAAGEAEAEEAEALVEDAEQEQEQGASEQAAEEQENAEGAEQQEEQENQAGGGAQAPGLADPSLSQLAVTEPGDVQDLFHSLFEDEDDDSENLALLARGLEDLDMRWVATKAQEILDQLYHVTRRGRVG